ncbi:30S ribosomal protein S17e [archaeon]|mgnify:CR=1 FL=1|jgi:ribosomal protein S17E|nr:30S ribosomal protein S17e [archaeon]MBT4373767.1 30S ribosomal protein S17e [archaeon]MBT4532233.1 30S ribosomal protein S17e [archaeon]MBT7001058.1 30S ribosomal protein S17e [archaeon]MBT7281947.1 30S ribosomal protein S17e [archaeon]
MGKIKSKLVRRTLKGLIENGIEFTEDFEKNKKTLGNTMPSKKIRNQIAGLAVKVKQQERQQALKIQDKK